MAKEQNKQINISFETVKKVAIGVLGVLFVAHIVTNIYIDETVRCFNDRRYTPNPELCHCLNKEFKNSNIFTKIAAMVDEDAFSEAKLVAGTRCAQPLMKEIFNMYN